MKLKYIILSFFFLALASQAQEKYITKKGYISFLSDTIIEEIKAENNQVLSLIDSKHGTIAIVVLMKSFMFEKSLMQEHFNENFVESDKYPKAMFKGQIKDYHKLEGAENEVSIVGTLTIHGITKDIEIIGKLVTWGDSMLLKTSFLLAVSDFNIDIPMAVSNNIAKMVELEFEAIYTPYVKKEKK